MSKHNAKTTSKKPLKERLKEHLAEYGKVAIVTYLVLFIAVICGFAVAIKFGFKTDSKSGTAGTWGAAWLLTKATQPIRIVATLAITPAIAAVIDKLRGSNASVGSTNDEFIVTDDELDDDELADDELADDELDDDELTDDDEKE